MKFLGMAVKAVLALVVLATGGLVVKFYLLSPRSRPPVDLKAPTSAAAVEHGRYLARNVAACMTCHSPVDETKPGDEVIEAQLGGGRDFGALDLLPGRVRARNLTPHPTAGIGAWTDGEVVRAMREGVSRDGSPLFPMMPYLTYGRALSDDDALSIVAYPQDACAHRW